VSIGNFFFWTVVRVDSPWGGRVIDVFQNKISIMHTKMHTGEEGIPHVSPQNTSKNWVIKMHAYFWRDFDCGSNCKLLQM
jgi:hypothetical protein